MAPGMKSRNKDLGNSIKGRQRKRKLSDMLGSQWSKDELERFYEAYRKCGKDWKKVAAVVRNRSIEMVEALYNMNRAYLSLPEGTASVVGLIAMMTDHYNVLEGSESEKESNDASEKPRKHQKGVRGKVRLSTSKEDLLQTQSVASNDGCLSFLKRRSSDGRVVGKRTPRFPVSYSYKRHNRETHISPNPKGRKSGMYANDDDVAHVAALALTQASQRVSSPQVSRTPYKKTGHSKSSPSHSKEGKAKLSGLAVDEDFLDDSLESKDGDARDTSSSMFMEGVGTVEVHQRGKKLYGKRENAEDIDDGREACSGTEEGLHTGAMKEKVDVDVKYGKAEGLSPQGQKRRSKKQLFGDEASAFDALQALADLSLMMPESTVESADKLSAPEATSTSHQKDKLRVHGSKTLLPVSVEIPAPRKYKPARDSKFDAKEHSDAKLRSQPASKAWKRKRNFSTSKMSTETESPQNEPFDAEVLPEDENKSANEGKVCVQILASPKQWKSARSLERSLPNSDQRRAGIDTAASTTTNQVILPTKQRSRRKTDSRRLLVNNGFVSPKKIPKVHVDAVLDAAVRAKKQLSCCLSSSMVRRWCTFEWFYSAIDYPWFAKKEFVEYLNHVGLGHIPRLTRVEWGVIRSSLGKPRRFSERFLHEEKEKLKQYRESVRMHYAELRSGSKDGLPTDLGRPLSVGQRVIALHPKTREIYDGSILTVDHDKCRVQFDCPEMGVEFVMDIDCMPAVPLENMPEAIRKQSVPVDKSSLGSEEPLVRGLSNAEGSMIFAALEHPEKAHGYSYIPPSNNFINSLLKHAKAGTAHSNSQAKAAAVDIVNAQPMVYGQPGAAGQVPAREADIQALSELSRTLDMKGALLMELKQANNEVVESQNSSDGSLKYSEPFKRHYATVLVQLKEASDQVASAVHQLRQRNTSSWNSLPIWAKQTSVSNGPGAPPGFVDNFSSNSQEAGSNVVEILRGSTSKAHSMVNAAVQAMSSIREGEDAFERISEALTSLNKCQSTSDSGVSTLRSPGPANGSSAQHNPSTSGMSECLPISHPAGQPSQNDSDKNELQIPSDLITSCVATLLMIQMCTERQYPPAEVAKVLDSAVSSLNPCCPQNLPIYREIQMCVGRIKTQILALIPT